MFFFCSISIASIAMIFFFLLFFIDSCEELALGNDLIVSFRCRG